MNQTSFKRRVAILRGGPSSEYDVSMQSGKGVLDALRDTPFITKDIVVTKSGGWLVHGFEKNPEQALVDIDVVFIALHGAYGEDGTVQRILERLCIPYTGSNSYASSIAINKALTKEHLKLHESDVLLPPHIKLTREGTSNVAQTVENIRSSFGTEYVIKPLTGGSSIGTIMANAALLYKAVVEAFEHYDEIIVEKRVFGKEATVGILEGFRNQKYYQLPAIEIVPPSSTSFFSANVKYDGSTQEICPGRFSQEEKRQLLEIAQLVHTSLGLRQYSRSDFIVNSEGIHFLEVNTLPGLTSQSLFPKSMEAVGSSYKELILHLLATA